MSRGLDPGDSLERSPHREDGRSGRSGGGAFGPSRQRSERRPVAPRDVFHRDLDLPRTRHREAVALGTRTVHLRDSDVRVLATVGAFRVVDIRDLTGPSTSAPSNASDPTSLRWHGDLEHLRQARLVALTPRVLDGERTALVTLTAEGRDLLEAHRAKDTGTRHTQHYYAGLTKPREATHDAQFLRLYHTAATQLHSRGAHVRRVVLDHELKRDYQRFLQERNRHHRGSSGRPDRSAEEIRAWAEAHHIPVTDGHVQFPDVRIEYEHPDGRLDRQDLELATEHYSARTLGAKRAAGFTVHRSTAGRARGASARRGKSPFDPGTAARMTR